VELSVFVKGREAELLQRAVNARAQSVEGGQVRTEDGQRQKRLRVRVHIVNAVVIVAVRVDGAVVVGGRTGHVGGICEHDRSVQVEAKWRRSSGHSTERPENGLDGRVGHSQRPRQADVERCRVDSRDCQSRRQSRV
jgi:hypothetical protein